MRLLVLSNIFILDAVVDLFEEVAGRSSGTEVEGNQILIKDNSVKWILMNPPYSRTRGGQTTFDVAGLNKQEQRSLSENDGKKLVKHAPVNNRAGMAASFLALANEKVKLGWSNRICVATNCSIRGFLGNYTKNG